MKIIAKILTLKHGNDPDEMFDPEQLARGVEVEMEHTDDPALAKQIAKGHLAEFKTYYIELEKWNLILGG